MKIFKFFWLANVLICVNCDRIQRLNLLFRILTRNGWRSIHLIAQRSIAEESPCANDEYANESVENEQSGDVHVHVMTSQRPIINELERAVQNECNLVEKTGATVSKGWQVLVK